MRRLAAAIVLLAALVPTHAGAAETTCGGFTPTQNTCSSTLVTEGPYVGFRFTLPQPWGGFEWGAEARNDAGVIQRWSCQWFGTQLCTQILGGTFTPGETLEITAYVGAQGGLVPTTVGDWLVTARDIGTA